jgi:multiple sugar transport system substrate-binding protein
VTLGAKSFPLDANGNPTSNHIYGIDGITIEGLAWSNGADWFNEDRTQLTLENNTKLEEAYQMFKTLYDLKIAPDADAGAGINLFYNGKLACYVGLRAHVPNLRKNCEFEWNCCSIPAFLVNPYVNSWSGSVGYGVSSKSKIKEGAYKLAEFFATKKGQLIVASTGFSIPFYDDEETLQAFYEMESQGYPQNTDTFFVAARYQRANRLTYLPGSYRWKIQMDLAYEKVSKNEITVKQYLSQMQTTIGEILKIDYPSIFK